jgi:hypothetical protein
MNLVARYGLPTVLPHRSVARLDPLRAKRHSAFSRNFKTLEYSNPVRKT